MKLESKPSDTQNLELLPQHNFSFLSFEDIRNICCNFRNENNCAFNIGLIADAFINLRAKNIDFIFSPPEEILNKYQEDQKKL